MTEPQTKQGANPALYSEHPDVTGDAVEAGQEVGSVQIHNSVIGAIARSAAIKVPGVVEITGGLVDGLANIIGKKSADRGIRVDSQDAAVSLDLHVVVDFGVRIPHVAWQIQTEVRKAVEQMTGKPVKAVNVIVQGIRLPAEEKQPRQSEVMPA